jgi:probable HAF family extracellular repeat protein
MLFRTLFRGAPGRPATRRRRGGRPYRPRLDVLEERCLLSYTITDILPLPGGTYTMGEAIDSGSPYRATGYGDIAGGANRAFWYEAGPNRQLPTLGGTGSYGYAVNGGLVAGSSDLPGNVTAHGFVWSFPDGMVMKDVGTFCDSTGCGSSSSARGVTGSTLADAKVVGHSDLPGNLSYHAFEWTQAGGMSDLGTLCGQLVCGTNSNASGINASGQIVGTSNVPGNSASHAVLFSPIQDLGTLGGANSYGEAISSTGHVAGFSNLSGGFKSHAFQWTPSGGMTDLGTLGGSDSYGFGVNASDQVVGNSYTAGNATIHAFLYDPAAAVPMKDLNDLIPPGSGWVLTSANGINDNGLIVGTGTINGHTHAFILTPERGGGPPPGWAPPPPHGTLPQPGASPVQGGLPPALSVTTPKAPVPSPARAGGGGSVPTAALLGAVPALPAPAVPPAPGGTPAAPVLPADPGPAPGTLGGPAPPADLGGGPGQEAWPAARPAPGGGDPLVADLGPGIPAWGGAPPGA